MLSKITWDHAVYSESGWQFAKNVFRNTMVISIIENDVSLRRYTINIYLVRFLKMQCHQREQIHLFFYKKNSLQINYRLTTKLSSVCKKSVNKALRSNRICYWTVIISWDHIISETNGSYKKYLTTSQIQIKVVASEYMLYKDSRTSKTQ